MGGQFQESTPGAIFYIPFVAGSIGFCRAFFWVVSTPVQLRKSTLFSNGKISDCFLHPSLSVLPTPKV